MNEAGPRTEWRKLRISELFCTQFKGTAVFVVAVWGEMCLIRHRQTHRESAVSIHNVDSPQQHPHHLLPTLSAQHGRHDDDLGFCLQQQQQRRQQSHQRCYRATRWACSSRKKIGIFATAQQIWPTSGIRALRMRGSWKLARFLREQTKRKRFNKSSAACDWAVNR